MTELPDDPEITELLNRPMTDEQSHAAFSWMQVYRMEALDGAHKGEDMAKKVQLVAEAQDRLKKKLRELLGEA